jgi:hypothetical protein
MVTLLSFFILSFSITPNLFTTSDDCDTERLLQVITKILIVMTIVTVNALLSIHVGTVCFPIQLQVQTTNFRSKIVSKSKSQTYNYQFQGGSSFNDTIWQRQNSLALSLMR